MASAPISSLTEVRALARLHPVPKLAVPALSWSGDTLSAQAYDRGSHVCLGCVDYLDGQFYAQALDADPEVPTGFRWRIIGSFTRSDLARSALEADVARRASLLN